ncbi:MAG: sensor histidine kinase [Bdellovibrionales bacterium]
MRFQNKIFIATYSIVVIFVTTVGILNYRSVEKSYTKSFEEKYLNLNRVLVSTFREMEQGIDKISLNAVKVLWEIEKQKGLPSDSQLKELATELNVSHFYVANKTGRFIRNTDLPPSERVMNIYDFCDGYRGLLDGTEKVQQTPILPSFPYTGPYKFTMIPNHNSTLILEVGYHMDYIGETFHDVFEQDKNIEGIGFFSPSGFELGSIDKAGELNHGRMKDGLKKGLKVNSTSMVITSILPVDISFCCECVGKGVSDKSGGYYYFLETTVKLDSLFSTLQIIKNNTLVAVIVALLFALIVSYLLSKRIVRSINKINTHFQVVTSTNRLQRVDELSLQDKEFIEIGSSFNKMISAIELAEKRNVESEKNKVLSDVASQVAHDICSPLAALEYISKRNIAFDKDEAEILNHSVRKIKDISNGLLNTRRKILRGENIITKLPLNLKKVDLHSLVDRQISESRMSFLKDKGVSISLIGDITELLYCSLDTVEFSRVISNLINNSVQAIRGEGKVEVSLAKNSQNKAVIMVRDSGQGIDPDIANQVFDGNFTSQKSKGNGLGLAHAKTTIRSFGGEISFQSKVGLTEFKITLPLIKPPDCLIDQIEIDSSVKRIFVLDDDKSVHMTWIEQAPEGIQVIGCYSFEELEAILTKKEVLAKSILLIDQDLHDISMTGLDFINSNGIQKSSILVTSLAEDEALITKCIASKVRLMPKGFISRKVVFKIV